MWPEGIKGARPISNFSSPPSSHFSMHFFLQWSRNPFQITHKLNTFFRNWCVFLEWKWAMQRKKYIDKFNDAWILWQWNCTSMKMSGMFLSPFSYSSSFSLHSSIFFPLSSLLHTLPYWSHNASDRKREERNERIEGGIERERERREGGERGGERFDVVRNIGSPYWVRALACKQIVESSWLGLFHQMLTVHSFFRQTHVPFVFSQLNFILFLTFPRVSFERTPLFCISGQDFSKTSNNFSFSLLCLLLYLNIRISHAFIYSFIPFPMSFFPPPSLSPSSS